ncbi:F-box/FBD/LRR-repeat protein-like protein [Drosera capensis]
MGISKRQESYSVCFSVEMAESSQLLHENPRTNTQAHVDRLTSLPCEIAEIILNKLPTIEASRTSILSSPWRCRWLSNSRLVIDSSEMMASDKDDEQMKVKKIRDVINYYLENHTGRVETFRLKMYLEENSTTVYPWLRFLRRKGVEELILEQCGNTFFYLCVEFLSLFGNLKSLSLTTVLLEFPIVDLKSFSLTTKKFELLIELTFIKVYVTGKDMEILSIACPKLEKLTLLPTYQLLPLLHKDNKGALLKIHGPSLKYFLTDFAYTEIWIKNASHLAVIEIATPPFDRSWKGGNIQWVKFIRGLSVLPSLKKLVVDGKFVESTKKRVALITVRLVDNNHHAGGQSSNTDGNNGLCSNFYGNNGLCPLDYLASKDVKKSRCSNRFKPYIERQAETGVCFRQLLTVKMRYTHQFGAALDFLEFVITRAPNIKTITIIKEGGGQYSEETIKRVCQQLKGCAPDAEVEFIAKDAFDMYNYFTATSCAPFYRRRGRPALTV